MVKWDIKDGFWRMDCSDGKQWKFAYVLPQPTGEPIVLVIPLLLQIGGWVEPFFALQQKLVVPWLHNIAKHMRACCPITNS
jgi:hypothetical protein